MSVQKGHGPAGGAGFAAAATVGALLASSCCVLPLMLVTLGFGGAWLSHLTLLEPWRPYLLAGTAVLLALGFWRAYAPSREACDPQSACAKPRSRTLVRLVLWSAAALTLAAATVDAWAPLFY